MTYLMMYLFTQLDSFKNLFVAFDCIVLTIFVILLIGGYGEGNKKFKATLDRYIKLLITVFVLSTIALAAVPSQKEMAAIYVIPTVVNNERLGNIAGISADIIEEKAKSYLEQMLDDGVKYAKEKALKNYKKHLKEKKINDLSYDVPIHKTS